MKNIILSALFITLLWVQPAYAYLDPGTGSMVVQIVIACFATIAVFFKSIWAKLKFIFIKPKAQETEVDEDDD